MKKETCTSLCSLYIPNNVCVKWLRSNSQGVVLWKFKYYIFNDFNSTKLNTALGLTYKGTGGPKSAMYIAEYFHFILEKSSILCSFYIRFWLDYCVTYTPGLYCFCLSDIDSWEMAVFHVFWLLIAAVW